jgi:GNAT superfamily N-acetyltransferase
MLIRRAASKDAAAIAKHNVLLAHESENVTIHYETTLAGVRAVLTDENKGFYLVAEEDNEIIGELMITFEWSDWRNKNMWWLQSGYVKKQWRRKGVFKQLIREVKKLAAEAQVKVLRLYVHNNNIEAMKAYQRMSMRKAPHTIYHL